LADTSNAIGDDYGSAGLGARIIAALEQAGVEADDLTCELMAPADQIHGGGLAATIAHAAMIPFGPDTRVLDIGCGIGGPARYLAKTFGCRVTGIDLTADFIDAARLLTGKMGLRDLVDFECADATRLPFEDATFDVVWSQNVAMNIADRAAYNAGIHRVLRPGGVFTLTEMCRGPDGAPDYPLPWARDPSYSFLVTPEQTRADVETAGFRVTEWRDGSDSPARSDRARAASGAPDPAPASPLTIEIIRGDDYSTRRANSSRGVIEGRLVSILLVAEKST
jgi:SAM-dependent methyltransferase